MHSAERTPLALTLSAAMHACALVPVLPLMVEDALSALILGGGIALHLAAVLTIGRLMVLLSLPPLAVGLSFWLYITDVGGFDCGSDCEASPLTSALLGGSLVAFAVVLAAGVVVGLARLVRQAAGR